MGLRGMHALSELKTLEALILDAGNNPIGDRGVCFLVRSLVLCPRLQRLSLLLENTLLHDHTDV